MGFKMFNMSRLQNFLIIYLSVVAITNATCPSKEIVCYYGSWAYYRPNEGSFTTSNIDPSLCTHLIYTFAALDITSHIYAYDSNVDITKGGYNNVTELKDRNECLRVSLAIGGWNEGSRKYSVMASTEEGRNSFADSVLKFLAFYGFDGIDIDWEYPTERGGIPEDKENLAALLKILRTRLAPWGLTITMAVPITKELVDNAYDVDVINNYVDAVHLMAYDYTSSSSATTGLLAPVSKIELSIDQWIDKGLSPSKLILGLPSYARIFELSNDKDTDIGAPSRGPGMAGMYTQEDGFLSYYELLELFSTYNFEQVSTDGNNYAYYSSMWVTYDNEETYKSKIKSALDKNLGGIMVWSIDTDDFSGRYSTVTYPLLRTVADTIKSL